MSVNLTKTTTTKRYTVYIDGFNWGSYDTREEAEHVNKYQGYGAFTSVLASWIVDNHDGSEL